MIEYHGVLESVWESLLSCQPELIREAFSSLSEEQRQPVLEHFERMEREPGWQPEQRISAQAALEVLKNVKD
jgi:hypothetical protein